METDIRLRTVVLVLITVVVVVVLAWVFRVKPQTHRPAAPTAQRQEPAGPAPTRVPPQWHRVDGPVSEVKCSYSFAEDLADRVFDGIIVYDSKGPRNRWATWDSGFPRDWIAWRYDSERTLAELTVHFFDDRGGTLVPTAFHLEVLDGEEWAEVPSQRQDPEQPARGRPNLLVFEPVTNTTFRVVVEHEPEHYSAITEIEIPAAEGG